MTVTATSGSGSGANLRARSSLHDIANAAQPGRGAVRDLEAGKVLVAARNLPDPNFAATVILLVDFSRQGAMGLIVNRPTKVTLSRMLPGLEEKASGAATAFVGGPVSAPGVLALLRSKSACPDCRHIVGDVYLVSTRDRLNDTLAAGTGLDRFRVYVGYAGWGAGQLENETAEGSWHVLDGDGEVVFDADPGSMWRRLIKRTEVLTALGMPASIDGVGPWAGSGASRRPADRGERGDRRATTAPARRGGFDSNR